MKSGCGVTFASAIQDALYAEIEGVSIPFASARTLWRMKQTVRAKDIPDRLFLRQLLESQGIEVEPAARRETNPLQEMWKRFKRLWRHH
jgi:hypothetical protein